MTRRGKSSVFFSNGAHLSPVSGVNLTWYTYRFRKGGLSSLIITVRDMTASYECVNRGSMRISECSTTMHHDDLFYWKK
jgi:hypothetical protein